MTILSDGNVSTTSNVSNVSNVSTILKNNKEIKEKLNVIICCSNPCQYASRYRLAKEFIKRINENNSDDVNLYVIELVYKSQEFHITEKNNPNHLQLKTESQPMWHKENLLNIGIKKLLPESWKYVAWIDADIEFDNAHWASDTLKLISEISDDSDLCTYDIVQLFSHALDMNSQQITMSIFAGFGYQYIHKKPFIHGGNPNHQWHPGYAWAMNRKAYDKMGGLFEYGILGAGDHHMTLAWIGNGIKSVRETDGYKTDGYKTAILNYQEKCKGLKLGYTPGIIRHYYHGSKKKRFYNERWQILLKHNYDPYLHLNKNNQGLLIPSENCPTELLNDIMNYFKSREEDENEIIKNE